MYAFELSPAAVDVELAQRAAVRRQRRLLHHGLPRLDLRTALQVRISRLRRANTPRPIFYINLSKYASEFFLKVHRYKASQMTAFWMLISEI